MCVSVEADIVAGIVVGAVAVDGLRYARRPAERLLAAIPVVLGLHQLVEAVVWLGLDGAVPRPWWRPAAYAYLVIAFAVLPVLVPLAVGALEPRAGRRRIRWFVVLGAAVAAVLTSALVRGPLDVADEGRRIGYEVGLWHGGVLVALYVLATCGSLLSSSHRHVRWFGSANLVAAAVLAYSDRVGFISLWCMWAAVTSVGVVAHLRWAEASPAPRVVSARP